MKALVLKEKLSLAICDIPEPGQPGADEVQIKMHTVGICGSDVHYYQHGRIGNFIVNAPMVLGHEGAGVITRIGANVKHLAVGDRVCMEPGIPCGSSRQLLQGRYNIDPDVKFWATPPVDGCLCEYVTHSAAFTFRLPDNVSFSEGAMVEPLAIGMHGASLAQIKPGDTALVIGAGTIGILTALAALSGGCSQVVICDPVDEKLQLAAQYDGLIAINAADHEKLSSTLAQLTEGLGADVVFECSGSASAIDTALALAAPGGTLVLTGMPVAPVKLDVVAAQVKEVTIKPLFRYVNQYPRTLKLLSSGKIDLRPLISGIWPFEQAQEAFGRAAEGRPGDIKLLITLP